MSKHSTDFAGLPVETTDENALLRAALAEAQRRISDLERDADSDMVTPLPTARRFRAELERVVGLAERHGTSGAVVGISSSEMFDRCLTSARSELPCAEMTTRRPALSSGTIAAS